MFYGFVDNMAGCGFVMCVWMMCVYCFSLLFMRFLLLFSSSSTTYERHAILDWFGRGHRTSPLTGAELDTTTLIPNLIVKQMCASWRERYGS